MHRSNATYYRRTGVDGPDATRALDLVAESLAGGHRTRAELTAALEAGGMAKAGLGFTYLMMLAELDRIAISGANAGQASAPTPRSTSGCRRRQPKPRDEALAELAARYLAARGPATDRDFAAWSGFTLGDTRRAFADVADATGGGASRRSTSTG